MSSVASMFILFYIHIRRHNELFESVRTSEFECLRERERVEQIRMCERERANEFVEIPCDPVRKEKYNLTIFSVKRFLYYK